MPTRSLQIREFPSHLYAALNAQAQAQHRSLAQQAIAELERALQPQIHGIKRMQTLQKLRAYAQGARPRKLGKRLVQWQRQDRER